MDKKELSKEEAEAKRISKEEHCVQHVNYNVKTGTYYVSDWFNCDSTVASYDCGVKVF